MKPLHPQQPNTDNPESTDKKATAKERKIAVAVAEFSHTLDTAAHWRRGELPPDSLFSYLWRVAPALLPFVFLLNFPG